MGINYYTRYVHGLSLRSIFKEKDLFHPDNLDQLILNDYNRSKKPGRNLVVYIGRESEKELLMKLGLSCVNLEDFGCRKFNDLPLPIEIKDCGYHQQYSNSIRFHCPMINCEAFKNWIKTQINN